jgi:hypothetical protein
MGATDHWIFDIIGHGLAGRDTSVVSFFVGTVDYFTGGHGSVLLLSLETQDTSQNKGTFVIDDPTGLDTGAVRSTDS